MAVIVGLMVYDIKRPWVQGIQQHPTTKQTNLNRTVLMSISHIITHPKSRLR
jgi:hypothetical protein